MAEIIGTTEGDTLTGTGDADYIDGLEGDDTITGQGGDDTIVGGAGADDVDGGSGDDTFIINTSSDFAVGDAIDGGTGFDTLYIDAEDDGFTLGSLTYLRLEALHAAFVSYPLYATAAQLGAFVTAQGYLRISGSGSVTVSGVVFQSAVGSFTSLILDPAITHFSFSGAIDAAIQVVTGHNGVTVDGSASNDSLLGGDGNDTLNGGAGDDTLVGGFGADTLNGGIGNDTFSYGVNGDYPVTLAATGDTVSGGDGTDTLSFYLADEELELGSITVSGIERLLSVGFMPLRVTAAELAVVSEIGGLFRIMGNSPVTLGGLNIVSGALYLSDNLGGLDYSAAAYTSINVYGSNNGEVITAGNGTNTIDGQGGNDTIYGGTAYNAIYGGDGDDTLHGGSGYDQLFGGAGMDAIHGGVGDDDLYAGTGAWVLAGEVYDGGVGDDSLHLNSFVSEPTGPVDLTSVTLVSIENLYSNLHATRLSAAQMLSVQHLSGKFLLADNAAVSLAGFTHSGLQITLADGGQSLNLAGSSAYYANLGVTVYGGAGNDVITGGNFMGLFYGGDGDDTLIEGTTYLHTMDGGAGNDRLQFTGGGVGIGGSGHDVLAINGMFGMFGVSGFEAIELASGSSLILTGSQLANGFVANTTLTGTGNITVNMTAGVKVSATAMAVQSGSAISFTVNGTNGNDAIKASLTASNSVNGDFGNDQIRGGNLIDTISGGSGVDKIMGLGGADILTGGDGNDQFRYMSASDSGVGVAADRITDFAIGSDRLNFLLIDTDPATAGDQGFAFIGSSAFSSTGTAQIRFNDTGANLVIQADINGDGVADMEVVLQGLTGQILTQGEFIL